MHLDYLSSSSRPRGAWLECLSDDVDGLLPLRERNACSVRKCQFGDVDGAEFVGWGGELHGRVDIFGIVARLGGKGMGNRRIDIEDLGESLGNGFRAAEFWEDGTVFVWYD